jgi:hypothetical protein
MFFLGNIRTLDEVWFTITIDVAATLMQQLTAAAAAALREHPETALPISREHVMLLTLWN